MDKFRTIKSGLPLFRRSGVTRAFVVVTLSLIAALVTGASGAATPANGSQVAGSSQEIRESGKPTKRIVGGWPTNTGKWSSIVSLVSRNTLVGKKLKPIRSAYWGHYCGGVLVTRTWVLSAAHCAGIFDFLVPATTDVVIGRTDLKRPGQGERIPLRAVRLHPGYKFSFIEAPSHDFMLLKLARPVKTVQPLGLSRLGGTLSPGTQAEVAGWGVDYKVTPNRLHETVVDIQADEACLDAYYNPHTFESGFKPKSMICAGAPEGGRDSCQGDSGGPLMAGGRLVGLASFGIGCGLREYPGVYAKVDSARSWIKRIVSKPKTRPGLLLNKHAIREKRGWTPALTVEFGLATLEWVGFSWYQPVFRANRHLGKPEMKLNSNYSETVYCPGDPYDGYPFNSNYHPIPDGRCQFGQGEWTELPIEYGGMTASTTGWGRNRCVPISFRSRLAGKVRRFNLNESQCNRLLTRRGARRHQLGEIRTRPILTPRGMGWEVTRKVIVR